MLSWLFFSTKLFEKKLLTERSAGQYWLIDTMWSLETYIPPLALQCLSCMGKVKPPCAVVPGPNLLGTFNPVEEKGASIGICLHYFVVTASHLHGHCYLWEGLTKRHVLNVFPLFCCIMLENAQWTVFDPFPANKTSIIVVKPSACQPDFHYIVVWPSCC